VNAPYYLERYFGLSSGAAIAVKEDLDVGCCIACDLPGVRPTELRSYDAVHYRSLSRAEVETEMENP